MNTSFACKAAFAYVYDLCALSGLCVQIRILRVKRILCVYTTCALEEAYAYKYVFALKAGFNSTSW